MGQVLSIPRPDCLEMKRRGQLTDDGFHQVTAPGGRYSLLTCWGTTGATEAARAQPDGERAAAHDAFTRLLYRLEPDAQTLWKEAAPQVEGKGGVLWMTRPWINPTPSTSRWYTAMGRASITRWWGVLT